jgi:hypothetical protein
MTSQTDNEREMGVLIEEHRAICDQIKEVVSYSDKMLALFLTVTGVLVGYGMKENMPVIIVMASFLVMLLMLFALTMNSAMLTLGGYRMYIEDKMNTCLGKDVVFWEKIAAKRIHYSYSLIGFQVMMFMVLVWVLYYGMVSAQDYFKGYGVLLYINILYVLGFVMMVLGFVDLRFSHKKSHIMASELAFGRESFKVSKFKRFLVWLYAGRCGGDLGFKRRM